MTPIRETIARALFATRFSAEWETDRWARARAMCRDEANDVLRALDEAGCVVVPKEPTEAMKIAGVEAMGTAERASQTQADTLLAPRNDFQRGAAAGGILACNSVNLDAAYRAMVSASVIK